jgi:hypothetical protein
MTLGGGRVGRERDGVLGFDPDAITRQGAELTVFSLAPAWLEFTL